MLNISLGLFVAAALVGLYMASRIFRNAFPPWGAAIFHGLFAASGLLILLYVVLTGASNTVLSVAAVLLTIAALGGFFALSYHARKQVPPKALIAIHALAAVIGVAALLGNAMGLV